MCTVKVNFFKKVSTNGSTSENIFENVSTFENFLNLLVLLGLAYFCTVENILLHPKNQKQEGPFGICRRTRFTRERSPYAHRR